MKMFLLLLAACGETIVDYPLSKELYVPAQRLNEIVRERRGVTADTAMRLARYFGTTEQFWLNLQTDYDLRRARAEKSDQINKLITPRKPDHEAA